MLASPASLPHLQNEGLWGRGEARDKLRSLHARQMLCYCAIPLGLVFLFVCLKQASVGRELSKFSLYFLLSAGITVISRSFLALLDFC